MAFKYEEAVPWGRSYDEYLRMFDLGKDDLRRKILGCADGPASFAAGMSKRGRTVVSCDPLYECDAGQIRRRIDATYEDVLAQTRHNQNKFVWERITSLDELGRVRLEAMSEFLDDYDQGRVAGRYVAGSLPDLPFAESSFELALCSHFLFFYSDLFTMEFHRRAVDELCRVAREVRIFPLVDYDAEPSPWVAPTVDHLKKVGRSVSIESVPYEFQRGGNEMMRIVLDASD
ncbi:MAG TPA: hypothetical protein VNV41_16750 [Candidatus Acidoferrales bacterium]|nr:hypothetical protein [Candidatus Acidoferrales bacterium]